MVLGINHTRRAATAVADKYDLERPHAKRTATMGLSGRPLRWTMTACSVTAFQLFGYDQGLMSSIITSKQFVDEQFRSVHYYSVPDGTSSCPVEDSKYGNGYKPFTLYSDTLYCTRTTHMQSVYEGAVTACYEIGCFFGSLFVLAVGNRTGRKPLIVLGCLIIVIGGIISSAAYNDKWGFGQFIIGRVTCGVGNGMNTATIPVWQSEVSRPEIRGRLVNLEGSVVALGTMVAYWLTFGLHFVDTSIAWRLPVALQCLFAIIVFVSVIYLPESPKWLVTQGRIEEATSVQASLLSLDENDQVVQNMITASIEETERAGSEMRFADLLKQGKGQYLARTLIGASSQFYQQFSGCNAAIYYATVLFQNMLARQNIQASPESVNNRKINIPILLGAVFASVYFMFTIPSFILVDKVGRRIMFLVGAAGQAGSFFITVGCLAASDHSESSSKKSGISDAMKSKLTSRSVNQMKGGAVGLFLFISFFGLSILELPWIYPPEINPMKTRTAATAVSTCANWLANYAVVQFTTIFINRSDYGCYLFFALINLTWIPLIFFCYPETAGRKLEEMDIIFARAYMENRYPFVVASEMPYLSDQEIKEEAIRLDLGDDDTKNLRDVGWGYHNRKPSPDSGEERKPASSDGASSISALSHVTENQETQPSEATQDVSQQV